MGLSERSRTAGRGFNKTEHTYAGSRELAETEAVIMRAALAYTISRWLLDKVDGVALNAPDADQDEMPFRSV